MLHKMKLYSGPFQAIKTGYKSIELRLNDEKRQKLQIGDHIEFTCIDSPDEKIIKKIKALHEFENFEILFQKLPLLRCGETPFSLREADPEKMRNFYSPEKLEKYHALGIELEEIPLQRFLAGQSGSIPECSGYETALEEIRNGLKKTHWIWYVFPQIKGLTPDPVTEYYALQNIAEAKAFLHHAELGKNLLSITETLLKSNTSDPVVIFGKTDAYKLRSCMTLFSEIAPEYPVFEQILDKFCLGTKDENTLRILSYEK